MNQSPAALLLAAAVAVHATWALALVLVALAAALAIRAERKRRASAERHTRDAYDACPDPVVYMGDGPVTGRPFQWVNDAAVEAWGRSRDILTTVPYDAFLVPETVASVREAARASDRGRDISGLVTTYTVPPDAHGHARPNHPQRWRDMRNGYWMATPIADEIDARRRAAGAEARAREAVRERDATENDAARASAERLGAKYTT